jgi:hypothetical protein
VYFCNAGINAPGPGSLTSRRNDNENVEGLRKSELRGLTWASYNGEQLSVERSVWNSTVSEPKTKRSRSPIPIVRPLAEALERLTGSALESWLNLRCRSSKLATGNH